MKKVYPELNKLNPHTQAKIVRLKISDARQKRKADDGDVKKARNPYQYGGSESSLESGIYDSDDSSSCESGDADDSEDAESEESTDVGVSEMGGATIGRTGEL